MYIYLIVNRATGKYYVGQHKGHSLRQYLQKKFYDAFKGRGGSSRLYRSMRKHGRVAFSIHALLSDVETRAELDRAEKEFIAFLKSQDPEYGYNICRGGEGFSGPHRPETRAKIAAASEQMWKDPEVRDGIVAQLKGQVRSPETVEKLRLARQARLGVPTSPETVRKLRDSHTGLVRSGSSRKKQARSVTGAANHFHGKKHSEESLAKMRESQARLSLADPTYRPRLAAARKAAWTPERRAAQSRRLAEHHRKKKKLPEIIVGDPTA